MKNIKSYQEYNEGVTKAAKKIFHSVKNRLISDEKRIEELWAEFKSKFNTIDVAQFKKYVANVDPEISSKLK